MFWIDKPRLLQRGNKWHLTAHLVSDCGVEALHKFARRIGLSSQCFHNKPHSPHYDLFDETILKAIQAGAKITTSKMLIRLMKP